MSAAAAFAAGWVACSVAVAFALGALMRLSDLPEPVEPAPVEPEPVYVRQSWLA